MQGLEDCPAENSLCDFALYCLFICLSDPNVILSSVVHIHLSYKVQIELY